MCFEISASLKAQLKRAIHNQDKKVIEEIMEKMKKYGSGNLYHVSGYDHPAVLIYTKEQPRNPILAFWGLVPDVTKNKFEQMQIWNKTLNARGEEMFEKWSYKDSAKNKRCLICVDGFFEYFHFNGKTYPYYIYSENNEPLTLAGLWAEWKDRETGELLRTFTIVTSRANALLSEIHNNPALKESRMPLILPENSIDEWLTAEVSDENEKQNILNLVKPFNDWPLSAFTVPRLKGKNGIGNQPQAIQPFDYRELMKQKDDNLTLF